MSELSTDVLALSSFPDQSTRTVLVKKVRKDPSKQRTRWKKLNVLEARFDVGAMVRKLR